MGDQVVEVACYSGAAYAERPQALLWHGYKIEVTSCIQSQFTPEGKVFDVILANGWKIHLRYSFREDHWIAEGIPE